MERWWEKGSSGIVEGSNGLIKPFECGFQNINLLVSYPELSFLLENLNSTRNGSFGARKIQTFLGISTYVPALPLNHVNALFVIHVCLFYVQLGLNWDLMPVRFISSLNTLDTLHTAPYRHDIFLGTCVKEYERNVDVIVSVSLRVW